MLQRKTHLQTDIDGRFKHHNYLGFHNPYYTIVNEKIVLFESFGDAVSSIENRVLDISSIIEMLCKGYMFGDKTIIKGIYKTPWLAKPSKNMSSWDYFELPRHNGLKYTEYETSSLLYSLLEEEVSSYVENHSSIGILLTGGMDSRIVACVLNNLIVKGEISGKRVLALTWGMEDSRDVQYAKRIADMFRWDWKHVAADTIQMRENIDSCVENGCEFSPLHLHAMNKVANISDLDCVLAGSFGDSIGRGEYSGVKVENLSKITDNLRNFAGILKKDVFDKNIKYSFEEVERYHSLFPRDKEYQVYEVDMQLHYMRRMLNPCMAVINKNTPLYQVFSSPEVYAFMWSLDPTVRKDGIYEILLKTNCPELLEVPWARTGLVYPDTVGQADEWKKRHHEYGKMIRSSFLGYINNSISSNAFINLNVFGLSAVKRLLMLCRSFPISNSYFYEERLLWLACLSNLVKKYNIKGYSTKQSNDSMKEFRTIIEYMSKFVLNSLKLR